MSVLEAQQGRHRLHALHDSHRLRGQGVADFAGTVVHRSKPVMAVGQVGALGESINHASMCASSLNAAENTEP